jgi:hypothetical protein
MEMLSRIPEERWKDSDPGLVAFARSGREVKAIGFIKVANGRGESRIGRHSKKLYVPTSHPSIGLTALGPPHAAVTAVPRILPFPEKFLIAHDRQVRMYGFHMRDIVAIVR